MPPRYSQRNYFAMRRGSNKATSAVQTELAAASLEAVNSFAEATAVVPQSKTIQ